MMVNKNKNHIKSKKLTWLTVVSCFGESVHMRERKYQYNDVHRAHFTLIGLHFFFCFAAADECYCDVTERVPIMYLWMQYDSLNDLLCAVYLCRRQRLTTVNNGKKKTSFNMPEIQIDSLQWFFSIVSQIILVLFHKQNPFTILYCSIHVYKVISLLAYIYYVPYMYHIWYELHCGWMCGWMRGWMCWAHSFIEGNECTTLYCKYKYLQQFSVPCAIVLVFRACQLLHKFISLFD